MWEWDRESLTGWILTSPRSPKSADLAHVPALSLTYWAPDAARAPPTVMPSSRAIRRIAVPDGAACRSLPAARLDPSMIPAWPNPDAPDFGVLRLTPRRLR